MSHITDICKGMRDGNRLQCYMRVKIYTNFEKTLHNQKKKLIDVNMKPLVINPLTLEFWDIFG